MDAKQGLTYRYGRLPDPHFEPAETGLLVIDVQLHNAHSDHGLAKRFKAEGLHELVAHYTGRLGVTVGNIQRLLAAFRQRNMEVIYAVIESLTRDGRDRSLEHKRLGIHVPPGSKEAQVLPEVAPIDDEIVIKKTCGSVFNGASFNYVLHNIGIRTLVVCGVVTSGCVEATVRDASNLSYEVVVVEDACATWSQEMHDASIYAMKEVYAKVYSTGELLKHLDIAVPLLSEPAPR